MIKHIYKLLIPVLTLMSTVCLAFGLSACNNDGKPHEHAYGNWEITAPTNDVTGSAVKTCTTCKEGEEGHYVIVTLPVLSDTNYNKSEDTATCTEGGVVEYSITIQGETFSFNVETSEKGHTFDTSKWEKDASGHWHAAICEHTTLTDSFADHIDNNSDFECDVCGYPWDGAHAHSYGNWQITKPTDTEVGSAVKTCLTCEEDKEGHNVTITLPVLGDEKYSKSVDTATCEDGGEIVYTLSIDNETVSFAIETSAKGHSFNEEFWLGDGFTHWREASCGHNVKGKEAAHVDENGDLNCDICGYPIHQHSYKWNGDANEHWLEPTCGDTTEIKDKGQHIDVDNDDMCDACGRQLAHKHKYSEDWTFDENAHWHAPICTDTTEGADEAVHTFKNGVCECGAVEAETNAYKILKEKADLQDGFVEWLNAIKENGVTNVTATESGDVIYVYGDGTTEAAYVAERTVKVKAVSSGEGVANVWIMLTLYKDDEYQEINGSYALGVAETDENGVAEITFIPVSGYTSKNVDYRVRLAEKKDIATYLGVSEENTPKPIPNRYSASGSSDSFIAVEVNENATSDDIAGQFSFSFSKGWNAYEQFTLPYARYYEKPYEGEDLRETGTTYELMASGENLFDYFFFTPSRRYSFASADSSFTPEQLAVIVENFQKTASGIYRIYFTVEGNANVTLYYWNEGGVNMGAYHVTKADGTPSDEYITSISGGTAGDGKYTGGNYVELVIEPENGLREFQLGIISDSTVKITFTVERVGDYVEEQIDYELTVGNNTNGGQNFNVRGNGGTTAFSLVDVPEGLYAITVSATGTKQAGLLSAYIDVNAKSCLYEAGQYKGVINIPANAKVLYIENESTALNSSINLVKYEVPKLSADKLVYVPATSKDSNEEFEITLDNTIKSGSYLAEITLFGSKVNGSLYDVIVVVGTKEYVIKTTEWATTAITYSTFINISEGNTIKIKSSSIAYSSMIVGVKLTSYPTVLQDSVTNVNYDSEADSIRYFAFTALKTGTYRLSLKLLNVDEIKRNRDLYYIQVENNSTEDVIVDRGEYSGTTGILNTEATGTFELKEGETLILKFNRLLATAVLNIDFVIEYVS